MGTTCTSTFVLFRKSLIVSFWFLCAAEENSQDIDPLSSSDAFRLKSGFLDISEESCLEFWYHKLSQKSSKLKVFLAEDILQTLVWSSETARNGDWRQVYIPLKGHPDNRVQVQQLHGLMFKIILK